MKRRREMSWGQRIGAGLAALVVMIAGLVTLTAPAAQAGTGACSSLPAICFWTNINYDGSGWLYGQQSGCIVLGPGRTNTASSLNNTSNLRVRVYDSTNCASEDPAACVFGAHEKENDLRGWPCFCNDRISSFRWLF